MDWFFISPFSISVLNVAVLIAFMVYFLRKSETRTAAGRHLSVFLAGVGLVFLSFFFIFATLDYRHATAFWWLLHLFVFAAVAMVQFAYYFPKNLHPKESALALKITVGLSLAAYPHYIWKTLQLEPVYSFAGMLYSFLNTPEIAVVIVGEILWMLAVFVRKARAFGLRTREGAAIRNLGLVFITPVVLIAAIIMAYLGKLSWDVVGHILGSGFMIVAFAFITIYINASPTPSTFSIKLIGLSLGTVLIIAGFGAAVAYRISDESFHKLRLSEIPACAMQRDCLPEQVNVSLAYITAYEPQGPRLLYDRVHGLTAAEFAGERKVLPLGKHGFRKLRGRELDPAAYFIRYGFPCGGMACEAGFDYSDYRAHLHETGKTLLWLIAFAVLFVTTVFPLFFRETLFKPLEALLSGVKKVDQGDLGVSVPVRVQDEIGFLAGRFNNMVRSVADARQKLQDAFEHQAKLTTSYSRFVPKALLDHLSKQSILDVKLGDHVKKDMSVLFSDIRSFTTLSETMTPQENFDFVNSYLGRVGPIVRGHGGFIDKFIGDAVMALFAAPSDAVRAALEMQAAVKDFNTRRQEKGFAPIHIGIGIHTGPLMLGTVGEVERMQGTVISDAVNVASRIEGLTKEHQAPILISADTHTGLKDASRLGCRRVGRAQVKGRKEPIEIFEVPVA